MDHRLAKPLLLASVIIGVLVLSVVLIAGPGTEAWRYDLDAYLAAARRAIETGNPFDPAQAAEAPGAYLRGVYRYAPPFAVWMTPLLAVDGALASVSWAVAHIAALAAACLVLPVPGRIRAALFAALACSYPAIHDLLLGNVSLLVLLATAVGWRFLGRARGMVPIALAAFVRPNLLLIAVAPIVRSRGRLLVPLLLTGIAVSVVTLPAASIASWSDWLGVLVRSGGPPAANSLDPYTAVLTVSGSTSVAGLARLVGYVVAFAVVLVGLRRDPEAAYTSAAAATLLAAPVLWSHYLALLAIPAAFLAVRRHPAFVLLPLVGWLPAPVVLVAVVVAAVLPLIGGPQPPRHQGRRPTR